jgi:hypothetical protein
MTGQGCPREWEPVSEKSRRERSRSFVEHDLSWSMIFSENRFPPVGSKPKGMLFRIMLLSLGSTGLEA